MNPRQIVDTDIEKTADDIPTMGYIERWHFGEDSTGSIRVTSKQLMEELGTKIHKIGIPLNASTIGEGFYFGRTFYEISPYLVGENFVLYEAKRSFDHEVSGPKYKLSIISEKPESILGLAKKLGLPLREEE